MASVFDVPGTDLVHETARELKQKGAKKPSWTEFVKTGVSRERAPQEEDWYYVRMASILRRIYIDGPQGVQSLRTYYGGRKNRGVRPHKVYKASGKIVRSCLQELDLLGFTKKEKKGRTITPKGTSFLNKVSKELAKKLKEQPKKERKKAYRLSFKEEKTAEPKAAEAKKGKKDERGRADKGAKAK